MYTQPAAWQAIELQISIWLAWFQRIRSRSVFDWLHHHLGKWFSLRTLLLRGIPPWGLPPEEELGVKLGGDPTRLGALRRVYNGGKTQWGWWGVGDVWYQISHNSPGVWEEVSVSLGWSPSSLLSACLILKSSMIELLASTYFHAKCTGSVFTALVMRSLVVLQASVPVASSIN